MKFTLRAAFFLFLFHMLVAEISAIEAAGIPVIAAKVPVQPKARPLILCGAPGSDLSVLFSRNNIAFEQVSSVEEALKKAGRGAGIIVLADGYPETRTRLPAELTTIAEKKKLRIYIEYPASVSGPEMADTVLTTRLERAIVTSSAFGESLPPMSLIGINDCHIIPSKSSDPLIVLGKVAGFDKAEYGIDDVQTYPLLFHHDRLLVATTRLSSFATGRYGPSDHIRSVWEYIISWVAGSAHAGGGDAGGDRVSISEWPAVISPMYGKTDNLSPDAAAASISKGVDWFFKGRFFVHPSWKDYWRKYQGNGANPVGPPLPSKFPTGDGSLGILEGHTSAINYDGKQRYRYWMRADVQGEVMFALAAAGSYLKDDKYQMTAERLADYVFLRSNLRSGEKSDPESPAYGLIGWSVTHPDVFYGDDNARFILGLAGASAYLETGQWDRKIAEAILANFRTTGKQGFRGSRLSEKDIIEQGWRHFNERDLVNPHPHFESWMWACYLWLYDKTGYQPLFDKTLSAIRTTMEAYPDKWNWTNGIQQERARMVLPLAWLVRLADSPEHRAWLDQVVGDLLVNQMECGAIREELGKGKGRYGRTPSNKEYGLHEAPLIFENGDPVADMLYTSNFAFFSLNEAARATGDPRYTAAVGKLAEFLIRIQVQSDRHPDLDGAWFRAFDYGRWDYWASNADAGWGAWSTLTGWTQSWIVATQVLWSQSQSYWDVTASSDIEEQMPGLVELMMNDNNDEQ